MVARVEALLEKYRVKKPEEMTQEEFAAYYDQQKKAQESYNKKIDEIETLLVKDEKYKDLSENQRYQIASQIYQKHFGLTFQSFLDEHPTLNNQPKLNGWAQFTFEEILQMESDGVNIPKEVLDWAHSMQDSDATDYVAEDLETLSFDANNSEITKLQKKTIALKKQATEKEAEISEKETRLKELADEAEAIKRDQEDETKNTLKQIQDLTKEWKALSKKAKKGGLSDADAARMKELGTLLNGEDGKLTVEVQASSADMQDLMNLMDGLTIDIEKSIDIGEDTIQIAKELSSEERFYHPKTIDNGIINMTVNSVQEDVLDAKGQNLSVNALDEGNKLVDFSNTLNNELMMGQYKAIYDFAKIFTDSSSEALQNTQEAMGEDWNKTGEEFESEEIDTRSKAEREADEIAGKGGPLAVAAYMGAKSVKYSTLTEDSIINIKQAAIDALIARILSDNISEKTVKSTEKTNETIEELEERKVRAQQVKEEEEQRIKDYVNNLAEKAEEGDRIALEILRGLMENTDRITEAIQSKVDDIFSDADQVRIDQLKADITYKGQQAQNITDKHFEEIKVTQDALEPKEEESALAEDYGTVAVSSGAELLRMYGMVAWNPLAAMMFASMLVTGMFAVAAGNISQLQGKRNLEEFDKAQNVMTESLEGITVDQSNVEATTGVTGQSASAAAAETEDGAEGEVEGEGATAETGETGETAPEGEEVAEDGEQVEIEGGELDNVENIDNPEEVLVDSEAVVDEEVFEKVDLNLPEEMTLGEFITSKVQETEEIIEAQETEGSEETEESDETETTQKTDNIEKAKENDGEDAKTKGEEAEKEYNRHKGDIQNANKGVADVVKNVEAGNKESIKRGKEGKKTEKELEAESKAVMKDIEKEQKKIEKLTKDSAAALQEQLMLGAEYESLAAQSDAAAASIQAKQDKAASAAPKRTPSLLSGGGAEAPNIQQEIVVVTFNQGRMDAISGRFTQLDARITKNRTAMIKGQATVKTRIRKFEKIANAKVKLQKEAQKAEQAKQKEIQKQMALIGVFNNIFSIINTVGTILHTVGDFLFGNGNALVTAGAIKISVGTSLIATGTALLVPTFGASSSMIAAGTALVIAGTAEEVTGAALIGTGGTLMAWGTGFTIAGTAGILSCSVANGAIQIANGNLMGGLMQIGMAIVQAVMSFIPGAGTAAQGATSAAQMGLTITSSTLNITATSLDMANNIKMANGEKADENLALASQIIGMTSALVGAGSGFASGRIGGGFESISGNKQASTLLSFFGAATSTAGKMSAAIKERQGEKSGVLESVLGFLGGAMETAGGISNNADPEMTKKLAGSIISGVGSVVSSSAAVATAVKLSRGEKVGTAEGALAFVGSALQTIGGITSSANGDAKTLSGSILKGIGSIVSSSAGLSAAIKQENGERIGATEAILQTTGGTISAIGSFVQVIPSGSKKSESENPDKDDDQTETNSNNDNNQDGDKKPKTELTSQQKADLSAAILQLTGSVISTAGTITTALDGHNSEEGAILSTIGNSLGFAGLSVTTINNIVQGLKENKGDPFAQAEAAGTILQLMGKAATLSAQMSANIKQATGERAVEAEEYVALAGAGLTLAGSATSSISKMVKTSQEDGSMAKHGEDKPQVDTSEVESEREDGSEEISRNPQNANKPTRAERRAARQQAREERQIARQQRQAEIKDNISHFFNPTGISMKDVIEMRKTSNELEKELNTNGPSQELLDKANAAREKFANNVPKLNQDVIDESSSLYTEQIKEHLGEGGSIDAKVISRQIDDEVLNDREFIKQATTVEETEKAAAASGNAQPIGDKPAVAAKPATDIDITEVADVSATVPAGNQPAAPQPAGSSANTGDENEQGGDAEDKKSEDKDGKQEAKKAEEEKKQEQRNKIAKNLKIAQVAIHESSNVAKVAYQIAETVEMNKLQDAQHQRIVADINLAALERSRALTRTITRKHAAEQRHSHYNRKA